MAETFWRFPWVNVSMKKNGYLQDAKEKDQEPDGALVSRAALKNLEVGLLMSWNPGI